MLVQFSQDVPSLLDVSSFHRMSHLSLMLVQFSQDVPSAGSDFPLLFDDSWMLVTCIPFFMMDLYYVPHTLMWPA